MKHIAEDTSYAIDQRTWEQSGENAALAKIKELEAESAQLREELIQIQRGFDGHVYVPSDEYAQLCEAEKKAALLGEAGDKLIDAIRSVQDWSETYVGECIDEFEALATVQSSGFEGTSLKPSSVATVLAAVCDEKLEAEYVNGILCPKLKR